MMTTKLLLADDSVTIHKVVALTFAAEDVQIEAVADGDQALERARSNPPDIILADVFMPAKNGYEVCEAIKSDPRLAQTPVVLLVGTFEPFDEQEATRVQCDAFLTKPFDTTELIQIVRHLVKQHGAAKEAAEARTTMPETEVLTSVAPDIERDPIAKGLISERTRSSFLGADRILDLFDSVETGPELSPPIMEAAPAIESNTRTEPAPTLSQVIPFPTEQTHAKDPVPGISLSEEAIDHIVSRVVKRMSDRVVREIAWEVVPEISEIMVRQYIDELRPKKP
jgi:CheY-like chemotaxis protein